MTAKDILLDDAVKEALDSLSGPLIEWVNYDTIAMMGHTKGTVGARFRMANRKLVPELKLPTDIEIQAALLRAVVERLKG